MAAATAKYDNPQTVKAFGFAHQKITDVFNVDQQVRPDRLHTYSTHTASPLEHRLAAVHPQHQGALPLPLPRRRPLRGAP